MIYPLDRHPWDEDRTRLKVQIEALVTVLITPGAWYDLSIPKLRLRVGQVLWEISKEVGNNEPAGVGQHWSEHERRWLLIQILLAIELLTVSTPL